MRPTPPHLLSERIRFVTNVYMYNVILSRGDLLFIFIRNKRVSNFITNSTSYVVHSGVSFMYTLGFRCPQAASFSVGTCWRREQTLGLRCLKRVKSPPMRSTFGLVGSGEQQGWLSGRHQPLLSNKNNPKHDDDAPLSSNASLPDLRHAVKVTRG